MDIIMGSLKLALICIHFLAWPVIALGYPLFASIRAVETYSKYHLRKLVMYWTLFSLISLFEFAFVKIIEWIPFWSSIKLIAIFWLVIPRFDGACHAYHSLVRPVLSVNLREVINRFYKPKEEKPCNKETLLEIAEKYIKENGSEALEKLIASKHECKECKNSQMDTQALEPEEKNSVITSKLLKEPDAAQLNNEMSEATKKSAATEAKKVQQAQSTTAAWFPMATDAAAKVKETTPPEASAENRCPETPPLKKAQQEWTCDLCKVTATGEETLNDHLQESKHKSNCEALKASKLNAKDIGPLPSSIGNSNQYAQSDTAAWVPEGTDSAAKVKEKAPPEASAENRRPKTPPSKEVQQKWTCRLCKVRVTSEKTLNDHLHGSKHKAKYESLKASKLNTNNTGSSPSATGNSSQGNWEAMKNKVGEGSQEKSSEKPQGRAQFRPPRDQQKQAKLKQDCGANSIFCDLCNVKLVSDINLASHVKGRRHLSNMKKMLKLDGVVS